jgi:transcriptional regulator with XRE-family HTH domain
MKKVWQKLFIINKMYIFATSKQMTMNQVVARNLKKLREAAGYTQDEVAQALGVTRSAYSNYESGDREAPYDVLEKVSDFFGCDMYILFEENENVDALILASAFRIEGINPEDAAEIMHFKDIVKSYLKMEAIEAK